MSARAPFLRIIAISSELLLLEACAHGKQPASERVQAAARLPDPEAPPDDPADVIHPSGACCRLSQRTLRADEPTPYGLPITEQLAQLGVLRCPLRYVDGKLGELRIQVEGPGTVHFRSAELLAPSCTPCFSELSFEATVSASSSDTRLTMTAKSMLRELEPGDGYVFALTRGELQIRGLLQTREPSLRVIHIAGQEETLIAEAQAACTSELSSTSLKSSGS